MNRHAILIGVLALTLGCGDAPNSQSAAPTTKPIVKNTVRPAPKPAVEDKKDELPEVENKVEQPVEKALGERFLLLAPGGPLIVDLAIQVDGQSVDSILDPLIDKFLKTADANSDGNSTWDEAFTVARITYGGFGNTRVTAPAQQWQAKQVFDTDRDGEIGRDEAARFVTNDANTKRAIRLTGFNYYRDIGRSRSPVRLLLDADEDRALSAEEIQQATQRLLRRDGDDDRILYPSDFVATANLQSNRSTRRGAGPRSALLLRPATNTARVFYSLEELYAYGGPLNESSFSFTPDLFGRLDTNNDGSVTSGEVVELDRVASHLRLRASIATTPELTIESLAAPLEHHSSPSDASAVIELPDCQLSITLRGDTDEQAFGQRGDALLAQYDEDNNGYLEEDEIPPDAENIIAPLAAVDLDGDEKVYAKEITEYLQTQQIAGRTQIQVQVCHREDALFAALDNNADGRLDEYELNAVLDTLSSLDANEDGRVVIDEVPHSMIIVIGRGGLSDVRQAPSTIRAMDSSLPLWFQRMDANQDGFVSRVEFLGESVQFDQLDTNGDQFISSDEIPATAKNLKDSEESTKM